MQIEKKIVKFIEEALADPRGGAMTSSSASRGHRDHSPVALSK